MIKSVTTQEDGILRVHTECPKCHRYSSLELDAKAYYDWEFGDTLIQKAFPQLSGDQRELLITGICPECWNKMFGE